MFTLTGLWFFRRTLYLRINGDKELNGLVLRYRSKLSRDDCQYEFEIKKRGNNKWSAKLNLAAIDLKVIYWDVICHNRKRARSAFL